MFHYNKYRNHKAMALGIEFDSKKEANRYLELHSMELAGEIKDLELQPKFKFQIEGKWIFTYKADFSYKSNIDGFKHVEDVKGVRTPVFNIKKKIIEAVYKIEIELV